MHSYVRILLFFEAFTLGVCWSWSFSYSLVRLAARIILESGYLHWTLGVTWVPWTTVSAIYILAATFEYIVRTYVTCYHLLSTIIYHQALHLQSVLIERRRSVLYDRRFRAFAQYNLRRADAGSVRKGHSHQMAADNRNSATFTILETIKAFGYLPYVVSPSMREASYNGYRNYFVDSDLSQETKNDRITSRHILVMTDVDYYVDMHYWLSYGRPILLYTFVPDTVSGTCPDGSFTIEKDTVKYVVSGGGNWQHQLWDYNHDVLRTSSFLGGTYVHVVDQFRYGDNRRIVCITPAVHLGQPGLFGALFFKLLCVIVGDNTTPGTELSRLKFSVRRSKINALTRHGEGDPTISLGFAGRYGHVELPVHRWETVRAAHQMSNKPTLADTQRRSQCDIDGATLLHEILQSEQTVKPAVMHKPGEPAVHYYRIFDPPLVEQNVTEYALRYAPAPLGSNEAVFPAECRSNTEASIKGRITDPQSKSLESQKGLMLSHYKHRFVTYMHEFVELLVPDDQVGTGFPLSVEDVVQLQNKPRQRMRSAKEALHAIYDVVVRAFQKREAYPTPNDPRNISSVPTGHTLKLSSYSLAFKELLKNCSWYCSALTPSEIAARVMNLAQGSEELVSTDFSRFDGHINEFLQNVHHTAMRRWVAREHHAELDKLLRSELNPRAYASFSRDEPGIKYSPGSSRLSGSPVTTDGNSVIHAFVIYCTNRHLKLDPRDAFNSIGLVCGDDGLRPGVLSGKRIPDATFAKTAEILGLSLKVEGRAHPGEPVTFLSRVFIDPWTTPASIQQPLRALQKVHLTTDRVNSITAAGRNKAGGYLQVDRTTPGLSNWCECYLRITPNARTHNQDSVDTVWWSQFEETANWPAPDPGCQQTHEIVSRILGLTPGELTAWCEALDAYEGDVGNIPSLDLPAPDPKIDAVVAGEVRQAGSTNPAKSPTRVTEPSKKVTDNVARKPVQCTRPPPPRGAGGRGPSNSSVAPGSRNPGVDARDVEATHASTSRAGPSGSSPPKTAGQDHQVPPKRRRSRGKRGDGRPRQTKEDPPPKNRVTPPGKETPRNL